MFEVGDKVLIDVFKDEYDGKRYVDWVNHSGEVGTIFLIDEKCFLSYSVKWSNGKTSFAPEDMLKKPVVKDWKKIIECDIK